MRFTEEELRRAAVRVQERQLAMLPPNEACTDRFSPAYARKMEQLILDMERGKVPQAVVSMGWPYYMRRSVAAILLCFLLACVAMPDAVMAGYQKMLEAVQKIYEIYTEYRYNPQTASETEFVPLQPSYLPEGMEMVMKEESEENMDLLYLDKIHGRYFNMFQHLFIEDDSVTYIIDSENTDLEIVYLGDEEVKLFFKGDEISFIWLYNGYEITGKTNLSKAELLQILRSIE